MNMRSVEYQLMLVSYVDILGFRELVSTKSAGDISRILRVFSEVTAPPKFKHDISDMPRQERQLLGFEHDLHPHKRGNRGIVFNQFLRLVHAKHPADPDEGVLIRGGIAVGQATSYGNYFGPAVIQA